MYRYIFTCTYMYRYLEDERLVVVFSDCYGVNLCEQASFFCRTMRFFFGESFDWLQHKRGPSAVRWIPRLGYVDAIKRRQVGSHRFHSISFFSDRQIRNLNHCI